MRKLIATLLLACSFSQTAFAAEEHFSFAVRQDGKKIKIVNHTVSLEKRPFQLVFIFNKPMQVLAHASFQDKVYKQIKSGKSLEDIKVFEDSAGKGMADDFYNVKKSITINNEAFNVFNYDSKKDHRFDKIFTTKNRITGFRTIESLYLVNELEGINEEIELEDLKNSVIYLSFANLFYDENYTEQTEIQRDYLKIKFK